MTAILALICSDGILMMADTEEAFSPESKGECDKLQAYTRPHGQIVMGAAGDSAISEYAMREIGTSILSDPQSWDQIEAALKDLNRRIFRETIGQYKGLPPEVIPPYISMLIAIQSAGNTRLFRWEHTVVRPIGEHTSIGAGISHLQPYLRDTSFVLPSRCMLLFGVHAMSQTKRTVQGCGGKTEAIVLHPDSKRTYFYSDMTTRIEQFVVSLIDYTNKMIWTSVAGFEASDKDLERAFSSLPSQVRRLRGEYAAIVNNAPKL